MPTLSTFSLFPSLFPHCIDLEKVVENVVSSLKEAEEAVKSAIAAVASKEGLTDSAKAELTYKLEEKAKNIEESIKGRTSHMCELIY